jgi:hypothetical protein
MHYVARWLCRKNLSLEAASHKERNEASVVNVRMAYDNAVELWGNKQWNCWMPFAAFCPELYSGVKQNLFVLPFEQKAAPANLLRCAKKRNLHACR